MNGTAVMQIVTRTSTTKGANNELRRNGFVPGNIYGKGVTPIPVAVRKDIFRKCLTSFGRNSIFKLETPDNNSFTAMVKEIQVSPIVNEFYHIDFQQVSLSEEVKADVAIRITGLELLESKKLILNRNLDSLLVTGLPQDIPDKIDIDVSRLTGGDNIKVGDITLPEGIKTEAPEDQLILSVSEARVQDVPVGAEE